MGLLDLPVEILSYLPTFIHNIEDFNNLSSTCRWARYALSDTSPRTILRLAAASAPTFVQPHPWTLVAATASQVADWAAINHSNEVILRNALHDGIEGLYQLCLETAGLTMADLRRLHSQRFSILNVLSDKIDKMAGHQWQTTPGFWEGGVSEPGALFCESERAAMQMIVYGELFRGSMEAVLHPSRCIPRLGHEARLDYVTYCVPELMYSTVHAPNLRRDSRATEVWSRVLETDQSSLLHITSCSRWQKLWKPLVDWAGQPFNEDWKQKLLVSAMQWQGMAGMAAVTQFTDASLGRIMSIYEAIESLPPYDRPGSLSIGRAGCEVTEAPDLHNDLQICIRRYWPESTASRSRL